jgi:hypothetical protein
MTATRRVVGSVLLAVFLSAAVVLFADLAGSARSDANAPRRQARVDRLASTPLPTRTGTVGHGISPILRAHFAIFRHTRRIVGGARRIVARAAGFTVLQSAPPASWLGSPGSLTQFGLDLSRSQEVQTSEGTAWVIPGATGACIVTLAPPDTTGPTVGQSTPLSVCDSTSAILQNGLVGLGGGASPNSVLYGLLPNGNSTASLTAAGSQQAVSVANNVVIRTVPTASLHLDFKNASGTSVSFSYTNHISPANTSGPAGIQYAPAGQATPAQTP